MSKLTPKQRRFVEEYCVDFNATQAAVRAGYSERTARAIGSENLAKPAIKAEIDAKLDELSMTAAEALKRLTDIARGSIGDVIELSDDGSWRLDLQKAQRLGKLHLIHELSYDGNGLPKVKLYSAHEALRDIGKARGAFVDKVEHSGELPVLIVRREED